MDIVPDEGVMDAYACTQTQLPPHPRGSILEGTAMKRITEKQSFLLVGEFMHYWSLTEAVVDELILVITGLNYMYFYAIVPEIPVAKKLDIAKTLLRQLEADNTNEFDEQLEALRNQIQYRNVVAHYPFFPTPDADTLTFARFASKGRYGSWNNPSIQVIRWSEAEFADRIKSVRGVFEKLYPLVLGLQERISRPESV